MSDLVDLGLSERELTLVLEFVDGVLGKPSSNSREDHVMLIEMIRKKPEIIPAVKVYIRETRTIFDLLNSAFSGPRLVADAWG